jgi:RNA polymerase sigma factor (sigma-70 family)
MEQQFDTMSNYILLAKKVISKFAPNFYASLRNELLKNEDAIADIATAIMYADWKWDSNRVGFNGKTKSKYSYRNQCGLWAIKTYLSNKYKKKNQNLSLESMDHEYDANFVENVVDHRSADPSDIVADNEDKSSVAGLIGDLLDSPIISSKQKDQIYQYYFQNKTLSEIGKEYGVTREAIRQNIQKGLNRIKEYV